LPQVLAGDIPSGRDVRTVERAREQLVNAMRRGIVAGIEEKARAAMFYQQLAAAAAWGERVPVAGCHRHKPAMTTSNKS
jgi:ribosome modulation factor